MLERINAVDVLNETMTQMKSPRHAQLRWLAMLIMTQMKTPAEVEGVIQGLRDLRGFMPRNE